MCLPQTPAMGEGGGGQRGEGDDVTHSITWCDSRPPHLASVFTPEPHGVTPAPHTRPQCSHLYHMESLQAPTPGLNVHTCTTWCASRSPHPASMFTPVLHGVPPGPHTRHQCSHLYYMVCLQSARHCLGPELGGAGAVAKAEPSILSPTPCPHLKGRG